MKHDIDEYEGYNRLYSDYARERDNKPRKVKVIRHYRPLGFVVAISLLILAQLHDMGVSWEFAILIAALASLLMVINS